MDAEGYEQVMLLVKNQVTKSEPVKDEGVSFADVRNSATETSVKQQSKLVVKNEKRVEPIPEIPAEEGMSFADIRASLTEKTVKQKKNELKMPPKVIEKAVPAPTIDKNINKDTIRPSHIKSEHILYKSSGYLKDLIGEEK